MHTTTDTLLNGQLSLQQPQSGYRFGTDAVLLAASTPSCQRLLDLGCGVGAVMLQILHHQPHCQAIGVEIAPDMAKLASQNLVQNNLCERGQIICADATDKTLLSTLGQFDMVVSNPPYYPASQNQAADQTQSRNLARTQKDGDLALWLKNANRLLKPKGMLRVIYPANQLRELLAAWPRGIGAVRIIPIWSKLGEPAKRVIVQGIKGNRNPQNLLEFGLILHEDDGSYTTQAAQILTQGALWPI
jgi:tRNA1Val (adenine37-N6)-methyltransferase